jgi:hypothetical protein
MTTHTNPHFHNAYQNKVIQRVLFDVFQKFYIKGIWLFHGGTGFVVVLVICVRVLFVIAVMFTVLSDLRARGINNTPEHSTHCATPHYLGHNGARYIR